MRIEGWASLLEGLQDLQAFFEEQLLPQELLLGLFWGLLVASRTVQVEAAELVEHGDAFLQFVIAHIVLVFDFRRLHLHFLLLNRFFSNFLLDLDQIGLHAGLYHEFRPRLLLLEFFLFGLLADVLVILVANEPELVNWLDFDARFNHFKLWCFSALEGLPLNLLESEPLLLFLLSTLLFKQLEAARAGAVDRRETVLISAVVARLLDRARGVPLVPNQNWHRRLFLIHAVSRGERHRLADLLDVQTAVLEHRLRLGWL